MRICIVCDYCFPLRRDPTGKIAFLLAKEFSKYGSRVTVVTNDFIFKKEQNYYIEKIYYHCVKDKNITNYSLNEIKLLYKRSFFNKVCSYILLCFKKIKRKIKHDFKIKNRNFFNDKLIEYLKNEDFDAVVFVCGDYKIIENVKVISNDRTKLFLYAIDYWNFPDYKDFSKFVYESFDCVYGQISYEESKLNFVKGYEICRPAFLPNTLCKSKSDNLLGKYILSYFGNLYNTRDCTPFLDLIDKLSKRDGSLNFNMYTNWKKSDAKKYKSVNFKKMIFDKRFLKEASNSDFLIILDNNAKYIKWIPSKLYEYASFNKPIILFSDHIETSYSAKELEEYHSVLFVSLNDGMENIYKKIKNFIISCCKNKNNETNFYELYPECNPSWFCNSVFAKLGSKVE